MSRMCMRSFVTIRCVLTKPWAFFENGNNNLNIVIVIVNNRRSALGSFPGPKSCRTCRTHMHACLCNVQYSQAQLESEAPGKCQPWRGCAAAGKTTHTRNRAVGLRESDNSGLIVDNVQGVTENGARFNGPQLYSVAVLRWGQPSLPKFFGWINWFYSICHLVAVASQMMRSQAPKYFFF